MRRASAMAFGGARRRGMRASSLALAAHIAIGVLLYFALTLDLLIFTITGDTLVELIQEVAGEERGLTREYILISVRALGVDLATYTQIERYSVISGAERLFELGNTVAALAIVIFSVVFPILKLLSGLVHSLIGGDSRLQRFFVHFHRMSMLDVFVAAIVVFVIGQSTGYEVELGTGFYLFLGYWAAQYLANFVFARGR